MASLLLIAGILIALKYADEHEKREKNRESTEEIILSPDQDEQSPAKISKRDLLKPRYWHARRASRGQSQNRRESVEVRTETGTRSGTEAEAEEVPPPYEVPPMYRELEKVDYQETVGGQRT